MSGAAPDQAVRVPVSLQRWDALTFVHWRVPARTLRPLLPPGLALETDDGEAWIALTPFVLRGLRPPPLPPVPGWSTFFEVNLRTYVRAPDGHDGIWFLRVRCARRLVVAAFRGLGLPYEYAPGRVRASGETTTYAAPGLAARVRQGERAVADPLLDSLTGRWNAFTWRGGRLWRVPVEHEPWPLHEATLDHLSTDLPSRFGLPGPGDRPLVHHSPGVRVRIGVPRPA